MPHYNLSVSVSRRIIMRSLAQNGGSGMGNGNDDGESP